MNLSGRADLQQLLGERDAGGFVLLFIAGLDDN